MSNSSFFNDVKGIIDSLCPGLNQKYVTVSISYFNPHFEDSCYNNPCIELNYYDGTEKTIPFNEPSDFLNRNLVNKAQKLLNEESDKELVSCLEMLEDILHQVEDNDYFCKMASSMELDSKGRFSTYQSVDLELQNDGSEEAKNKYLEIVWNKLMEIISDSKIDSESFFDVISRALIQEKVIEDKSENAILLLSEVVKNRDKTFQVLGLKVDEKAINEERLLINEKFSINADSFFQRVLCVLFQKWSDVFKYSLYYSDSEYIMDIDAVIRLAVRDLTEGRELPSYKIIEAISGTRYENAECHGTIAFFFDMENVEYIPFGTQIHFGFEHIRYIRKLLELSSGSTDNPFVLCVNAKSPWNSKVVGLIKKEYCQDVYTVDFRGFLKWTLKINEAEIVSFDDGRYSCHKNRLDKYNKQLKARLKCTDKQIKKIHRDVETVWEQRHGTMLVLFSDPSQAEAETRRLVKMERGIGLDTDITMKGLNRKQLILSLTSIDGALFMDINGTIYGFGIIVDGKAIAKGTAERGARYNSAKNYIANSAEKGINNVALVVSEDRTVDLLTETPADIAKIN